MSLMCLLFPSSIFCFVRNKLNPRAEKTKLDGAVFNVFEYSCGNVLINTI